MARPSRVTRTRVVAQRYNCCAGECKKIASITPQGEHSGCKAMKIEKKSSPFSEFLKPAQSRWQISGCPPGGTEPDISLQMEAGYQRRGGNVADKRAGTAYKNALEVSICVES